MNLRPKKGRMEEKGGVGEKGRDGRDVCDMLNV